jgi:predicted Zn-dependent peptidase
MISAAGGVEHQHLVRLLEEAFSAMSVGEPRRRMGGCQRVTEGRVMELSERDLEQTLVCLGTEGLANNDPGRYTLAILNTILGGGMSSRLFQEIREKRGIAYSVYSYQSSYSDAGSLAVYAGTDRERSCEAVKIILGEMARFKEELVPFDELSAAREQIKGKILMSLESSDSYMSRLARSYLYFGRYQPIEELMAGFDAVTPDDLRQLARQLFLDSSLNIQVMGKVDRECFDQHKDMLL